ncbi:hypothetical protein SK128_003569 [Halocaridina rubra]|uniref:Uncharacterized protein n=1 Tax=Halocaridina rubra TaxID=373956 RepID=A0AAN8XG79_HALRR
MFHSIHQTSTYSIQSQHTPKPLSTLSYAFSKSIKAQNCPYLSPRTYHTPYRNGRLYCTS